MKADEKARQIIELSQCAGLEVDVEHDGTHVMIHWERLRREITETLRAHANEALERAAAAVESGTVHGVYIREEGHALLKEIAEAVRALKE